MGRGQWGQGETGVLAVNGFTPAAAAAIYGSSTSKCRGARYTLVWMLHFLIREGKLELQQQYDTTMTEEHYSHLSAL